MYEFLRQEQVGCTGEAWRLTESMRGGQVTILNGSRGRNTAANNGRSLSLPNTHTFG